MLSVLLKKHFNEKLSIFRSKKLGQEIGSMLFSGGLVAALLVVCIFVLIRFTGIYSAIRIDGVTAPEERYYELLTLIYTALLIISVIGAIKKLNFTLFENDDRKILITLPIRPETIFLSKFIIVYLDQVASFAVTILPIGIAFGLITAQSAYFYVMTALSVLLFPLLVLAIASAICLPVYLIKSFFKSKYLITLTMVTVALAVVAYFYSEILSFLEEMLITGEIRFFFNESTMNIIIAIARYAYPANLFASVLLKRNLAITLSSLLGITVLSGVIGISFSGLLYMKATQNRITPAKSYRARKRKAGKQKPILWSLILKEFGLVFRTPSYAFQYFSMAGIMPLMVFFLMGIGEDMLSTLIMTESNFELALFTVLLFGSLTNTFSATNISRDGKSFIVLKTLPVKYSTLIGSKVLFSLFISAISSLISVIVIASTGLLEWGLAFYVFLVAVLVQAGEIFFATKRDLLHPSFPEDEDAEVPDSNSTVSIIVVLGFLISCLLGGISLFISIAGDLGNTSSLSLNMLFTGLTALVLCALSAIYLWVGLDKHVSKLTEGV